MTTNPDPSKPRPDASVGGNLPPNSPEAMADPPSNAAPLSNPGLANPGSVAGAIAPSSPSTPIQSLPDAGGGLPHSLPSERAVPTVIMNPDAAALNARLYLAGIILITVIVTLTGLLLNNFWLTLLGTLVSLFVCIRVVANPFRKLVRSWLADPDNLIVLAILGGFVALLGVFKLLRFDALLAPWYTQLNWDAVGALGEVFGALGQILIAILAVYVAWRQYVIEKDLTTQQNIITQQQTIDSYFQGISDLVLDDEGLLEDWPQERAIAEGRTAAILSSVDGGGKAKIIRFLSRARLLTPLKRDQRLGRAILDGTGGYEEDRTHGVRVIDLGVMLANANLANTDMRWTDLSDINLIRANLSYCDLVKANFSRTILVGASLRCTDLQGAIFFYGSAENASPRSRTQPPNFVTGESTGAVVENVDLTGAQDMNPDQRYYFCAWGGSKTRNTVPGGCEGIPNKLGR